MKRYPRTIKAAGDEPAAFGACSLGERMRVDIEVELWRRIILAVFGREQE
jgi:hypothetical protein